MRGKKILAQSLHQQQPRARSAFLLPCSSERIQYFVSKSEREEGTTETSEMLETVHRKTVLEWFKRFTDKREGPDDEPMSEKLSNVRSFLNCWQSPTNDPQTDEGSTTHQPGNNSSDSTQRDGREV